MTSNCLLQATALVLAGILVGFSDADVYLHNPRGSNNRLNQAGVNRANNNRMFNSQNNAKGGYNVGDKNQASNSEETQFNMHYFQSGKVYAISSGQTGKSTLTIEWTNQHGCADRDLNCNIILQYRCQDDTKHQTLNHHTMRNGRLTSTPTYQKRTYTSRSAKNSGLRLDSSSYSRGLHESWEWYDKCVKRNRVGINCPAKTTTGDCCVFPFIYNKKRYDSCTKVNNGNKLWCATTSNYDKDAKYGNCKITKGKQACAVKTTSQQCCVFPFQYNNKLYRSCTKVNNGNTLWCATTRNYDKDHKWGNCKIIRGKRGLNDSPNPKNYDEETTEGMFDPNVKNYDKQLTEGSNHGPNLKNYDEERTEGTFVPNLKNYDEQKTGGLFTADQKLNGKTNIYTRQNPNGARSGYECPEERDYYPYWHPTDWTDIAIFAHNEAICQYYQRESFNVKPKEECLEYYNSKTDGFRHDSIYSNKKDCENNHGFWISFSNYLEEYPKYQTEQACYAGSSIHLRLKWDIPYRSEDIDNLKMTGDNVKSLKRCLVALVPPECTKAPHTRTNHLGNADGVVPLRYDWVIPHFPSGHAQRCIIRIRYNISTGDYPPFNTFGDKNNDPNNGVKSPVQNNPKVDVGDVTVQLPLQLAINTAQFGRTFQDRSHLFKLLPRPKSVSDNDIIHNLNARGKRGNIVQAFPAVEYDFIPKRLDIPSTSLVHIQWTGSNTNPGNYAGQGKAGTDRHNMVEMANPSVNYPLTSGKPLKMFTNADIVWSSDEKTKNKQDLWLSMASSGYYNSVSHYKTLKAQNKALNDELNNAPASYRGMLLRFAPGEYYYMCSRNNNFSNRNEKGRLFVRQGKK